MHLTHLLTMCCKSRRDCISYAKMLRRLNIKSNIEGRVRDCRLRLLQRIMNMPPNRLPRIVAYSVLDKAPTLRVGNRSQWKNCLWDDICKFGYANTKDKKTSQKGVVQPIWSKKLCTAGEKQKVLASIPGAADTWIWSRTIREQRDEVFMETFWKCESEKSEARIAKCQSDPNPLDSSVQLPSGMVTEPSTSPTSPARLSLSSSSTLNCVQ